MQWLFNLDARGWLAPLRQSPLVARAQVLLSAGVGLSGLALYFASECLRRMRPAVARSKS